jgi:hypothetical protein
LSASRLSLPADCGRPRARNGVNFVNFVGFET